MPADRETDLAVIQEVDGSVPLKRRPAAAQEEVSLSRDCPAVLIPAGTCTILPAGTRVTITQQLGADFTVRTSWGYLARIAGDDADALGRERAAEPAMAAADEAEFREESVWDALRSIYDPEIPVNIVDLGLIYDLQITQIGGDRKRVEVKMTLTAPGCGMGQILAADVERKIAALPGVTEVCVGLVFDPPWDRSRMSEAARLELGLF